MMSERDADKLWDEQNAPGGPCGVCGIEQEDHGHAWEDGFPVCQYCDDPRSRHASHDWEPASSNAPDEPDED